MLLCSRGYKCRSRKPGSNCQQWKSAINAKVVSSEYLRHNIRAYRN